MAKLVEDCVKHVREEKEKLINNIDKILEHSETWLSTQTSDIPARQMSSVLMECYHSLNECSQKLYGLNHQSHLETISSSNAQSGATTQETASVSEHGIQFTAHLANKAVVRRGDKALLPWKVVAGNEGNWFDPDSGVFTSPVDGVYEVKVEAGLEGRVGGGTTRIILWHGKPLDTSRTCMCEFRLWPYDKEAEEGRAARRRFETVTKEVTEVAKGSTLWVGTLCDVSNSPILSADKTLFSCQLLKQADKPPDSPSVDIKHDDD